MLKTEPRLPLLPALFTLISPPWSLIIFFDRERPRPLPFSFFVYSGRNILLISSFVSPMPVSWKLITAHLCFLSRPSFPGDLIIF